MRIRTSTWAVFYLAEELAARPRLRELPDADLARIAGDVSRAHSQLTAEWLAYARHLQADCPYLICSR